MSASETIVLAGGCFWCTEAVFKEVRGVLDIESGYSNGLAAQPSYEDVCTGRTGCAEVIKLQFDPAQIGLRQVLEIFFLVHDPTQVDGQGNDRGTQYRSAIFFMTPEQQALAQAMIAEMTRDKLYARPIVTQVQPLAHYWPAEDYHQDFFERNPEQGYCMAVAAPKVEKFRKTFREWAR